MIPFGAYVQAEVIPKDSDKNTQVKRSVSAIALMSLMNGRGIYLFCNMSTKLLRAMIRSSMFLKGKFNTIGKFQKMKTRLVAGGNGQEKELYENMSSPTMANKSVFMFIALAAILKQKMETVDNNQALC